MTEPPLTPAASPSDSRIVVDCPTCRRVIWAGARCYHGYTPLTPDDELPPDLREDVPPARGRRGKQ